MRPGTGQSFMESYTVFHVNTAPELALDADPGGWEAAAVGRVGSFHPRSSAHRPDVAFRLLHDERHLHLRFDVDDRYVRVTQTQPQSSVCRDSCVEFFVQPRPGGGYLNFEINGGGTMLLYCIEDWRRIPGGFARYHEVPPEVFNAVTIRHDLPDVVDPERDAPVRWQIRCRIPVSVLESCLGSLGRLSGQSWRANFFKCGDGTSHPHWASWNPIGEQLNFHQPDRFGVLHLG